MTDTPETPDQDPEDVPLDTENADDAPDTPEHDDAAHPLTEDTVDVEALAEVTPNVTVAGGLVRFLQWNVQQGHTTDGKNNFELVANWCVQMQADVISFNEIMHYASASADMVKIIADKLTAKTGQPWVYKWAQKSGAASGEGSAVMARFPFETSSFKLLPVNRVAVQASMTVNGRTLNVFSTHLDAGTTGPDARLAEIRALKPWAATFAQQRVIMGDFNTYRGRVEYAEMATDYRDLWQKAVDTKVAVAYPDNPAGNTRRARIDFVWASAGASLLVLKKAQVFDTRNAAGARPSDHNPLVVTVQVT